MTRYGHIGWRVAAVVMAFVGTAVLAVTLTHDPDSPQAAGPSAVCPTSGLQAWLGAPGTADPGAGTQSAGTQGAGTQGAGTQGAGTQGAGTQGAGATLYTLEFTNVSHRACRLDGYPEVSAYVASQTSSAAIRDTSVRPQPVTLEPGATAHSVLRVTDTGRSQPAACDQVTAEELRVTFPDQVRSAFLPVHIRMCSHEGHLSLSVQAIQARPGIPGYTMP
jgi:hypothetical protein